MKDISPRPLKRANRKNNPEFRETLGGALPMPAAATIAPTRAALRVVLGIALGALVALIIVNLLNNRPISPETSGIPGGAVLQLNAAIDTARADQARAIAAAADRPPAGQQTGVPATSSLSGGYGDAYAIQGSAGIPAARY